MDKDTLDARDQLTFCFVGGLFGGILGTILVAFASSALLDWFGSIIAGLSGLLVLVSAVGWGVSLGVRASGRFSAAAPGAPGRRRTDDSDMGPFDPMD